MKVIVPYRPDNGHRDRVWGFLRTHFWSGFDISIGHHPHGPFNRSQAINQAAVGEWDVAVIADADTWVPHDQLAQAVSLAESSGTVVAAFTMVAELTEDSTRHVLASQCITSDISVARVRDRDIDTQSSMLAVPRSVWDRVGGMDERFHGWGGEDNAFWKAATLHCGPPQRIPGYAYHLWHPPAPDKHHGPGYAQNLELWRRYQTATTIEELP